MLHYKNWVPMSLYATDLFYSINTEKWNSWAQEQVISNFKN